MITNQQLVQNNFEEKIKVFTHAVDGEFNSDETFSIANTGVPTDTFNTLLVKSRKTKDSFKFKQKLDFFIEKRYPFSVWVDARHMKDRKSTRLNSSHVSISYAVFCLKKTITILFAV